MAGQFKFVAVVEMVGCEPVKATVCPDYAARILVGRWKARPETSIKVVELDTHWATTILHKEEVADADGQ